MRANLLLVIWFAGLSIGTWRTVAEWSRRDLQQLRERDAHLPSWAGGLLSGVWRGTVPVLAACWGLGLLLLGARLLRSYGRDTWSPEVVQDRVVRLIDGGAWFLIACGVMFLSILLFNRPRILVPPPLRNESGLLGR